MLPRKEAGHSAQATGHSAQVTSIVTSTTEFLFVSCSKGNQHIPRDQLTVLLDGKVLKWDVTTEVGSHTKPTLIHK